MTQLDYSNIMLHLQKKIEERFIPSVYRAIKAQNSHFLADLKNHGLDYAKLGLSKMVMNPYVAKPIEDIHKQAGVFMARRVRQNIKTPVQKSLGNSITTGAAHLAVRGSFVIKAGFGFNARMVAEIKEYFRIFLLEKAVLPITQTTIDRINTILDKAITEGWGVERIVQEMEGTDFRDMTRRRAQMIVRTEVVRASNFGGMAAAYESDYEMEKVWVEVKDNRTRLSHRHFSGVGGQVRDLLSPYSNGGQFPGDPDLPAAESINCRCVNAYKLKRDYAGRPILKTPTFVNAPAESLANILAASIGISLGTILGQGLANLLNPNQ